MRQCISWHSPGMCVSKHIMSLLYPYLLYICFWTVNIHLSMLLQKSPFSLTLMSSSSGIQVQLCYKFCWDLVFSFESYLLNSISTMTLLVSRQGIWLASFQKISNVLAMFILLLLNYLKSFNDVTFNWSVLSQEPVCLLKRCHL